MESNLLHTVCLNCHPPFDSFGSLLWQMGPNKASQAFLAQRVTRQGRGWGHFNESARWGRVIYSALQFHDRTWVASSLVGARTSAWTSLLLVSIWCRMEMVNVAVLPVPDWAWAMTSLPVSQIQKKKRLLNITCIKSHNNNEVYTQYSSMRW